MPLTALVLPRRGGMRLQIARGKPTSTSHLLSELMLQSFNFGKPSYGFVVFRISKNACEDTQKTPRGRLFSRGRDSVITAKSFLIASVVNLLRYLMTVDLILDSTRSRDSEVRVVRLV